MLSILKRLFGFFSRSKPLPRPAMYRSTYRTVSTIPAAEVTANIPGEEQVIDQPEPVLTSEAVSFLQALLDDKALPLGLQSLTSRDRTFVSNNIRRMNQNNFEIPMLPHAAICIQQLLSDPKVQAADFIDVIKEDPTLSVELLRVANSSFLGFAYPTLDLQQAITRIGFTQLHGLVTMLALRSRILQGAFFQNEVEWVMEMSLSMAKLCQHLAPELEMKPEEAFTVGLLNHIEYLVVLSEASQFSAENDRIAVSREAITETIRLLGNSIHELIAKSWGFGNTEWTRLVTKTDGERNLEVSNAVELSNRLDKLQRALVSALGGNKYITDTAGFDARNVGDAIDAAVASSASK